MADFEDLEELQEMEAFLRSAGYIHESELRELVEEWRENARTFSEERNKVLNECADELESVLEE